MHDTVKALNAENTYSKVITSFILIYLNMDGSVAEQKFLQHGIMIRNASEFGLDGWIRVSMGTFEENEAVVRLLKEIVNAG